MDRVINFSQFCTDKAEHLKEAGKIEIHEHFLQAVIHLAYKAYLRRQLEVFSQRMSEFLDE